MAATKPRLELRLPGISPDKAIYQVHAMIIRALLTVALLLVPTFSHADVLKCKIDGFKESIFITTTPDTNSNDGKYARIGISPGIGNRAIVVPDPMGAAAFVELNVDGAPVCCVYRKPYPSC